MDIPGTYSIMSNSEEEEIARDYICFGNPDATVVILDATCLERNLNLVFQLMEITPNIIEIMAVTASGLAINIIPNKINNIAITISVQPDFFNNFSNISITSFLINFISILHLHFNFVNMFC